MSGILHRVDSEIAQQLNHLMHLANDLCLAYGTAIRRIEDAHLKEQMVQLDRSHDRFRVELGEWIEGMGFHSVQTGDLHGLLERIRVVIGDLSGDEGILKAMAVNEEEMASALRVARKHPGMPADAIVIIEQTLEHEKHHREFYDRLLGRFVG
jgi:hypothetical protein